MYSSHRKFWHLVGSFSIYINNDQFGGLGIYTLSSLIHLWRSLRRRKSWVQPCSLWAPQLRCSFPCEKWTLVKTISCLMCLLVFFLFSMISSYICSNPCACRFSLIRVCCLVSCQLISSFCSSNFNHKKVVFEFWASFSVSIWGSDKQSEVLVHPNQQTNLCC